MKLYTSKQVEKAFKSGFKLAMETDGGLKEGQVEFLNSLTPIELPSDEEIENIMISKYPHSVGVGVNHLITSDERIGFEAGAKWMKEQILNQNK